MLKKNTVKAVSRCFRRTVAVSPFCLKRRCFHVSSNRVTPVALEIGSHCHEDIGKGEDAVFKYSPHAFGVADGVGGWRLSDAHSQSAEVSQKIMDNCSSILSKIPDLSTSDISAKELLCRAAIPEMEKNPRGSSTALVCLLKHDNLIQVANVGDCRFFLFRSFHYQRSASQVSVYFVSPEQIAQFNAPLQLGPIEFLESESSLVVDPRVWTECFALPVIPGDILCAFSDGVTDNLFPNEILECVTLGINDSLSMDELAESIVKAALKKQSEPYARTPFGQPKPDDSTAVVAKVV